MKVLPEENSGLWIRLQNTRYEEDKEIHITDESPIAITSNVPLLAPLVNALGLHLSSSSREKGKVYRTTGY